MFSKTVLRQRCWVFPRVCPVVYLRSIHDGPTNVTDHYDVIIAGGGMVGTTLACTLGQSKKLSNKKILLLEGGKDQKYKLQPKYSNRVVALNPSSKQLLSSIGAWQHISNARVTSVNKMQVWDACSDAMITFQHDNLNQDIAYIVENNVLLSAVSQEAHDCANVSVVYGAKIKSYELLESCPGVTTSRVHMEDGVSYSCNLLVGADGVSSKVRAAMGAQYLTWNYGQMGLVATVRLSEPTENKVAWQRFLPTGPVALLPLTDELSSLVWSINSDEARRLLNLTDECFADALNEALWKQHPRHPAVDTATRRLDSILDSLMLRSSAVRQLQPSVAEIEPNSRAAFPLAFGHSTRYMGAGVVLIGDAAHRVHPLAGQGVNLGFGDVKCLTEQLTKSVYSGQSIGSKSPLLNYETSRQRHNMPTMLAIDGLQKLYSTEATPIVVLRSLGLQLTHALTPLKSAIMNHAAV